MSKKIKVIILVLALSILIVLCVFFSNSNSLKNDQWILTQFGDNEGGQMMSFTIEGNKNGLVIIDGGYKDNDEQYNFLMDKIKKHHYKVDAWIITHFDSDHGGQFIRIASSNDIFIKNVFVADTPTDLNILKENAPYENDWSTYEEYLRMDLPQKVKVHSGNTFEFIDLKMKVLCSYEDWIDEKSSNLLNNGAIVFKIYGNKESLLFCGDVQDKVISNYLLENYKEDLKSDYLQVAHHGNNYLGEDFYKEVSPKIAFFSAPDWLMENISNIDWYTVKDNRAVLEEIGAKILWHNTSPNVVNFK